MVIFLYGPDTYQIQEKLKWWLNQFQAKIDPHCLSVIKMDGKKMTVDKFRQIMFPAGLFTTKRLVVIKNLFSGGKNSLLIKEIENYLKKEKKENDNALILIETEKFELNKENKGLIATLKKQKHSQEFQPLKDEKLRSWIVQTVKKRGGQISSQALNDLVFYFNTNLWQLSQEIDKLLAYTLGNIDKKSLILLIPRQEKKIIFFLIDALIMKDKKRALNLLSNYFDRGNSFSLFFSMLIRQFRIMLIVKDKILKRTLNVYQITKEFSLPLYPVKKAIEQSAKYQFRELKKIYQELLKIDFQLKTTGLEPKLLFNLLVTKL